MAIARPTIFIVDDDEVAVMAFERAARQHGILAKTEFARDGAEALSVLRARDRVVSPYLIVLDLNMPGMGGLEFLDVLRRDPDLKNALVFVMTTSDSPNDIQAAYSHNIAGYFVKENAFRSIGSTLALMDRYAGLVTFPD